MLSFTVDLGELKVPTVSRISDLKEGQVFKYRNSNKVHLVFKRQERDILAISLSTRNFFLMENSTRKEIQILGEMDIRLDIGNFREVDIPLVTRRAEENEAQMNQPRYEDDDDIPFDTSRDDVIYDDDCDYEIWL